MIRHNREIEDEEDEQLICTGWKMIGISLWKHPKFGRTNFTKIVALGADISNFHVIEIEHYKMLNLVNWLSEEGVGKTVTLTYNAKDSTVRANVLLSEMNYI